MQPPHGPQRTNTHSLYVVVSDADAHHSRAKKAGAEILPPPMEGHRGGRDDSCRDPEGHIGTFGIYDPWVTGP